MWSRMNLPWVWIVAIVIMALGYGTADVVVNRLGWRFEDAFGHPADASNSFLAYLIVSALVWKLVATIALFTWVAVSGSRHPETAER